MPDELLWKSWRLKVRAPITQLEERQLLALKLLYGTNLVLIAIKHSKTDKLREVARLLTQLGGFKNNVDPVLESILPDRSAATNKYTTEQLAVADRLSKAVRPISDEEVAGWKVLNGKTTDRIWLDITKQTRLSEKEEWAIKGALKKYGIPLVSSALRMLSKTQSFSEEERIILFKEWLSAASDFIPDQLRELESRAGHSLSKSEYLPAPRPVRIMQYFHAKTGRMPKELEARSLWELTKNHGPDEVIFAMSSIPGNQLSIGRLKSLLSRENSLDDFEEDQEEAKELAEWEEWEKEMDNIDRIAQGSEYEKYLEDLEGNGLWTELDNWKPMES